MKLAMVVPRYGLEVVGGAELAARMLCEHLVALQGWDVEVITTAALEIATWADHFPIGEEQIAGVRVRRHSTTGLRYPGFGELSGRYSVAPWALRPELADEWVRLQGPVSPGLIEDVASCTADVVAFYPYLYHPTVAGLPLVAERSVLHPAAHDEPPLYLPCYDAVFAQAGALVLQTESEARLVRRRFGVGAKPQVVVGLGVDPPEDEELQALAPRAASEANLDDVPYLFCLGRVEHLKGTLMLARWFAAYKMRNPGPLRLVLAGPVINSPPEHPDIDVVGIVSEEMKWGLLAGALAVVTPSPLEAFSLVLMEAMAARRPVLVNAVCGPTREHASASGAGLWFGSYAGFEAMLSRLYADEPLRRRLGEAGRSYVQSRFTWPEVISRYSRFVASRASVSVL